jgi:hypothetical protein
MNQYICELQFQPADREGTHCLGHLAEGHVLYCPYCPKDVQTDADGKLFVSSVKGSKGLGCCQDFIALEGLAQRLFQEYCK